MHPDIGNRITRRRMRARRSGQPPWAHLVLGPDRLSEADGPVDLPVTPCQA